ncbi:hypothetical protein GE21DRAFT_1283142 [Neurospora crassa]|nr:hypothetical protein GE21DRAFT_1283142 [Neurospora crassa]
MCRRRIRGWESSMVLKTVVNNGDSSAICTSEAVAVVVAQGIDTSSDFKCPWSGCCSLVNRQSDAVTKAFRVGRTNASVCWPSDRVPIQGRPRSKASSPPIHP